MNGIWERAEEFAAEREAAGFGFRVIKSELVFEYQVPVEFHTGEDIGQAAIAGQGATINLLIGISIKQNDKQLKYYWEYVCEVNN